MKNCNVNLQEHEWEIHGTWLLKEGVGFSPFVNICSKCGIQEPLKDAGYEVKLPYRKGKGNRHEARFFTANEEIFINPAKEELI